MQSATMSQERLTTEVTLYVESLLQFLSDHHLRRLFHGPVDHLALKAPDTADYEACVEQWLPLAARASVITLNNRRLATLFLREDIVIHPLGATTCLEIMEPRPEKVGKDFVGLEHIELYHPALGERMVLLNRHEVIGKWENNGYHQAIGLTVNDSGQEVKFTNSRLETITELQIREGVATSLL